MLPLAVVDGAAPMRRRSRRFAAALLVGFATLAGSGRARDASDCTGLVPPAALPPALQVTVEGSADICDIAGADGAGNFILERLGSGVVGLQFFSAEGRATGSSSYSGKVMPGFGGASFLGQADGFLVHLSGFESSTQIVTELLVGFAPDGTTRGQTIIQDGVYGSEQHAVIADPRGGAIILDVTNLPGSAVGPKSPWSIAMRRVSPAGVQIEGPRVLQTGALSVPQITARVDPGGSFLLLSSGLHFPPLRNNQLAGRWFDAAGVPLTGWFLALDQVLGETAETFGAADGGVGVRLSDRTAIVPAGSTQAQPAPSWIPGFSPWLIQLPDRTAVISSTDQPCADHVEIRAPAGNVCGAIDIPAGERSGFCQSGLSVVIGRDGTVLQRGIGGNSCSVRWWRRLLQ
jgi:hypothetical protein